MENELTIGVQSSRAGELLRLGIFLALASAVIVAFRVEYLCGFDTYFPLVAGAIFLHQLFPYRQRACLFPAWTLVVLALFAGPRIAAGTAILVLLAAAITYLPRILRNLSTAALFAGMIAWRVLSHDKGKLATAVDMAGIFIMLRQIFLLYEINYIKEKPSFLQRIGYLFMLPNIFFPLFPVVSPVVFFKHKEADNAAAIEQGKMWLTKGIIQLLLYRLVYLYVTPSVYELSNWFQLLMFLLSGYSLILRLSGIFYLSGGILGLMGYQLPPLFDNFFLVRNFGELWRKINLYWRHFILRVVYYPVLFRLKKLPQKTALIIAVVCSFIFTWFLHGWQWFWVKGFFPLVPNDMLYWAIFGLLITIVSVRQFSGAKKNTIHPFFYGISVVGMFYAMSVMWSLWTSSSLTEWFYIVSKFTKLPKEELLALVSTVVLMFLLGGTISVLQSKRKWFTFFANDPGKQDRIIFLSLLLAIGLFFHLKPNASPLAKMAAPQLNERDRTIMERGYYEQLLSSGNFSQELRPVFRKPEERDFQNKAYAPGEGIFVRTLRPSFKTYFKQQPFTTNRFGMRDKEYSLDKPPGVYRICLLGGSYEMGSGVADGQAYEQLTEDSLNHTGMSVEILNMGVGGYHLFQAVKQAKEQALMYGPDAMIYACHSSERRRMIENVLTLLSNDKSLEIPELEETVKKCGIVPGKMSRVEMYDRLQPYADSLITMAYRKIAKSCTENHVRPIWVYLPALGDLRQDEDLDFCKQTAIAAGFDVIDLSKIFAGKELRRITVSDEDTHPNALGHRIIANALYKPLREIIAVPDNQP